MFIEVEKPMKTEIYINRAGLKKALEVLDRFEIHIDENIKIIQVSDDIGYSTEVELEGCQIHGVFCTVTVPIVSHENYNDL
jgi:hypothetical protein